jgi:spermidine/putrescine transport system substrate-binding protein
MGLASVLAACGVQGEQQPNGTEAGAEGSAEWWADQIAKGPGDHVNFANWCCYIDLDTSKDGAARRPTMYAFSQETGIDVTYRVAIDDNATFYAQIRPALEAGQYTGHDIIVMSNFQELFEMIALGYLIEMDPDLRPNWEANCGPKFRDPVYDPGNKYTMVWQSGITALAYNTKYIDEPITSVEDFFNPKYAGHVAMFSDSFDSGSLAMLQLGIAPETSTPDDWQKAADYLQRFNETGVLRGWMDQAYLQAFEDGDLWATMAWSGDILYDKVYLPDEYGTFEYVVPDPGAVIFIDNACLPNKAENPVGAMQLLDWYYKPEIAAKLTEQIQYFTPVPGAAEIIQAEAAAAQDDPSTPENEKEVLESVANSPYVFPTPEVDERLHSYRVLEGDEVEQWNEIFDPIFIT